MTPIWRGHRLRHGRQHRARVGRHRSLRLRQCQYGVLNDDLLVEFAHACPIVARYGGLDESLRKGPVELEEILTTRRIEQDIHVYPEAGHGFLNNPSSTPPVQFA